MARQQRDPATLDDEELRRQLAYWEEQARGSRQRSWLEAVRQEADNRWNDEDG